MSQRAETAPPYFADRAAAGRALARKLAHYAGRNVLVLGIPRGGVPVAAEVAAHLGGELDIAVARKLGAPSSPELAVGAVTSRGGRYLNDDLIARLKIDPAYLARVTRAEIEEAERRERVYRAARAPAPIEGRTVIVVDDGLATGATIRAAIDGVRRAGPRRIVAAAPVGSREACEDLRAHADEVVCVSTPEPFHAVGRFYVDFAAVDDDEVTAALARDLERRHRGFDVVSVMTQDTKPRPASR